jgi:4-diphosphocytidyl-2-C-methyl-D-erythritol kinase
MVALDLCDELFLSPGDGLEIVDEIAWVGERGEDLLEVPQGSANLVSRALALVGRSAHVRLVKRIPPGAGLGGGSSNAAAILRWAHVFDPDVGVTLGADVPFCLRGGAAHVTGIGESLDARPFVERTFLLLTPALSVSTASVYAAYDTLNAKRSATPGGNDLEAAALLVEPRLSRFCELLREATRKRPQLAGSGSTWFVECDPSARSSALLMVQDAVRSAGMRAMVAFCHTVEAINT